MFKNRGQRGASMVEFALVLLPLLLITFGIIEFSLLLYDKAVITNASREGARFAALYNDPVLDPKTNAQIKTVVTNYVQNYLITFGSDTFDAGNIKTPTRTQDANGHWVWTIEVNYQYEFLVFHKLATAIAGPINLRAITVMRDEDQSA